MNAAPLPLAIIGAGGHAKVIAATAALLGYNVVGHFDAQPGPGLIGDDAALLARDPAGLQLALGIGGAAKIGNPGLGLRQKLAARFAAFTFPTLVAPGAHVIGAVSMGMGCQVLTGAVVHPACVLGNHVLINTSASVDHDCVLGDHVHVAPGAVLCGGVQVGAGSFIGARAVILPGVRIGIGAMVAAGAVVRRSVGDGESWLRS